MFTFGSGVLIGTRTDVVGSTPINFGLLQEVSIDVTQNLKELFGQSMDAVAIGAGTRKTTCKAKVARVSGLAFANLFFGVPLVAGQVATAYAELGVIPAVGGPYVVNVGNAANFAADAGVFYDANGLPLILVTAAPAAGQYMVANGVYTFAATDAGKSVRISYTYAVAGSGQRFSVTNRMIGTAPTFSAKFWASYDNKPVSVQLRKCISSKFAFGTKMEDFVMPEFDFSCFADDSGTVMDWSFAEAS